MKELLIRRLDDGGWEVVDPKTNETTGKLCYGEMLEQIVGLMPPMQGMIYQMKTPEEWDAERTKCFNGEYNGE